VNRVIINVVVTIFDGMKLQDESVGDAVLVGDVRLLMIPTLSSALNTCRFSVEISFPPEIDTMYGCLLQSEELRNHLKRGLSVAHQR
jgi:hypothetical protein